MKLALLTAFIVAAGALTAHADVVAMEKVGDSWQPMREHKTVRLVKRDTVTRLIGILDWASPAAGGTAEVTTTITLKNDGGAQQVWLAIPELAAPGGSGGPRNTNVTARSNNQPLRLNFVPGTGRFSGYWLTSLQIPVRATRVIRLQWRAPMDGDAKGFAYRWLSDLGGNWKGVIGQSQLIVDTAGITGFTNPYFFPDPDARSGKRLIWRSKNYNPSESTNVFATFQSRTPRSQ